MNTTKNPGYAVITSDGKPGRTYHNRRLINGKVPVYLETKKFTFSDKGILCNPKTLKIVGFVD